MTTQELNAALRGSIALVDKRSASIEPSLPLSPMQELQMQIVRTGDLEKLKQLREIEKEWRADEAQRLYNEAKAAFKRNPPTIIKNKLVDQGQGRAKYRHATLDECVGKIVPALAAVGLEHCWIPSRGPVGEVIITCRLSGFGHSEDFTLSAPPDAGPGRNAIQAVSSTVTYLERYTLLAATGLAAADQDDDGRHSGAPQPDGAQMDGDVADAYIASIEGAGTVDELQTRYMEAQTAAEKIGDKEAAREFAAKKNERYRKLARRA